MDQKYQRYKRYDDEFWGQLPISFEQILGDVVMLKFLGSWLLRMQEAIELLLEMTDELLIATGAACLGGKAQAGEHLLVEPARQPCAPIINLVCQRAAWREQRVRFDKACVEGGAGPWPLGGLLHKPGAHGIEFDVTHSLPQVSLVQCAGEIASLP